MKWKKLEPVSVILGTIVGIAACVCVLLCVSGLRISRIGSVVGIVANILTALATIGVAIVAYWGLHTWKHKERTQKCIQFMDELNDTVHEYIQAMEAPIQSFKFIKMFIDSHSEVEQLKQNNTKNAGIIAYIKENDKSDQVRLKQYLDNVRPIRSRMMSLATKGQVLGFDKYANCYNACTTLASSYDFIEAFASAVLHLKRGI